MALIAVVDYGMGNIGSIANMVRKCGGEACVASSPEAVLGADKIILPGVGSFDHGMRSLAERGLVEPLQRKVREEGAPLLGICLGMQLLGTGSEEGTEAGFGWIDARSVRFDFEGRSPTPKVPHMGWNYVQAAEPAGRWTEPLAEPARFYFVHSYHLVCEDASDTIGTTRHGYRFPSVVARDNLLGVQFHPEKSHRYGLALMQRFVES